MAPAEQVLLWLWVLPSLPLSYDLFVAIQGIASSLGELDVYAGVPNFLRENNADVKGFAPREAANLTHS